MRDALNGRGSVCKCRILLMNATVDQGGLRCFDIATL